MPRAPLAPPLLCAALLFAAFAAAADTLPAPMPPSGCVPLETQRLSGAGDAYRALYLKSRGGGAQITEEVHGLRLIGTEKGIGYLRRALGNKPPQSWQKALEAKCNNVLCALTKTIGDQEGALWFLVASVLVDAPPSLDQTPYEVESVWQTFELRALARALMDAPAELRRAPNLKVWRRLPSGQTLKKGAWYNAVSYIKDKDLGGLGTIVIRDTVWKFPQRDQRAVVLHELGHQWEFSRHAENNEPFPSLRDDWLSLSGWQRKGPGRTEHDYALAQGAQIATAGETLPTEDFADSIANYRFLPRLLRAYSQDKYEYMHKLLGGDGEKLTPEKELDAAWHQIGGPLRAIQQCAGHIQRATFGGKLHQHELYTVLTRPKGTHWEPVARNQFVLRGECLKKAMADLEQVPQWREVTCRHDPEDIEVAVTDRLEDAWAGFYEAAKAIREAVPASAADECVEKKALTQACFAGEAGQAAALEQAKRLLSEHGGAASDAPALAKALLVQTPLAPSDADLTARFPMLKAPEEIFFACLKGAVEISPRVDKTYKWLYWVKLPPTNEKRGFKEPLWTAACLRDFAKHLGETGIKVDTSDKLLEHFAYLARNGAAPLLQKFTDDVLDDTRELKTLCARKKPACAAGWLKPKLSGFLPPGRVDQLAEALSLTLRP